MRKLLGAVLLLMLLLAVYVFRDRIPGMANIASGVGGKVASVMESRDKAKADRAISASDSGSKSKFDSAVGSRTGKGRTTQPPGGKGNSSEKVPILMYHQVAVPKGRWKELFVAPGVFAGQLEWLKDNGYTTVTLAQLYDHWENGADLPAKPVVLTFDDGYRSMYNTVLPLLQERKMKATFFLYPKIFNTPGGLTNEMIAEMARDGMEIGSHTYDHVELTKIPPAMLKHELADSKAVLEGIIKKPVEYLCYPVGKSNAEVVRQAEQYGYKAAVTTKYGKTTPEQNRFEWKRIRINYSDGVEGMIRKISK